MREINKRCLPCLQKKDWETKHSLINFCFVNFSTFRMTTASNVSIAKDFVKIKEFFRSLERWFAVLLAAIEKSLSKLGGVRFDFD